MRTWSPGGVIDYKIDGDVWMPVAENLVFDAFGSFGLFLLCCFSFSS